MDVDVNLDLWISLFDVVILGLLAWGTYKGYKIGGIINSISVFSLLIGLTIAVGITKKVYFILDQRSAIADLIATMLFGILFAFAIIASNNITKKVKAAIADAGQTTTNRYVGATLGFAKFMLIISVYALTLFKIEAHTHFIPESEKNSKLANASVWVITKIFPFMKMPKKTIDPYDYPQNRNKDNLNYNNQNTTD